MRCSRREHAFSGDHHGSETVSYLRWLPEEWTKILAISRSLRSGYDESLAEYFVRLNSHLLGEVIVAEVYGGEA